VVKTLEELDRYSWSGHAVLMGRRKFEGQEVREVLERFGKTVRSARGRYRQFVAEGMRMGRRDDLVRLGMRGRSVKGILPRR